MTTTYVNALKYFIYREHVDGNYIHIQVWVLTSHKSDTQSYNIKGTFGRSEVHADVTDEHLFLGLAQKLIELSLLTS